MQISLGVVHYFEALITNQSISGGGGRLPSKRSGSVAGGYVYIFEPKTTDCADSTPDLACARSTQNWTLANRRGRKESVLCCALLAIISTIINEKGAGVSYSERGGGTRACAYIIIKIKNTLSGCEIEYFVETHLCKLCVILRSRVLLGVCVLIKGT